MSKEANLSTRTRIATTDLSGAQYCFVKQVAGGIALCGAGEKPFGVLQNKPKQGAAATVAVGGQSVLKAGGVIAAGASIVSDANGKAVTATTTGHFIGAENGPNATVANEEFSAEIRFSGKV